MASGAAVSSFCRTEIDHRALGQIAWAAQVLGFRGVLVALSLDAQADHRDVRRHQTRRRRSLKIPFGRPAKLFANLVRHEVSSSGPGVDGGAISVAPVTLVGDTQATVRDHQFRSANHLAAQVGRPGPAPVDKERRFQRAQ